ncbi:MAG TPA: TniB family NTP-binding protein [Gammaproteobacteria bacterium]|nr:TniB family NTP-binding protein [Gammaproteobacteria bacterium]
MTQSNDLSHLSENVRPQALLPDAVRVQLILRPLFVEHTAIKFIMNELDWMLSNQSRRAPGLAVCAPPGSGKTELSMRVGRAYPPRQPGEGRLSVMPVVVISMSGAYDMRTVYGRVMFALEVPCSERLTTTAREIQVLHLLRRVSCILLVLDEFQDISKGTDREQRRALDAVKLLMNQLNLPILALGTQEAGRALQSDAHLAARFSHTALPVWKKNAEFVALLKAVHSQLPLRKPSSLTSDEVMQRLLTHSKGILGVIMRLLQDAAIHAIIEGQEYIDVRMIDLAATRRPDYSVLKSAPDRDKKCA